MLMIISSDLMEGPDDDEIAKENAVSVSVVKTKLCLI